MCLISGGSTRLDRRCSAHPRSYPHAPVDHAQGRAQISAATPEAFVPWSLLPSRSTIKVVNDIIEVKCNVSQMCTFYRQRDTAFNGSRLLEKPTATATLGVLGRIRRSRLRSPCCLSSRSLQQHARIRAQPAGQEVKIAVVLVAYIIYTTSTLPTVVHKRLASPRLPRKRPRGR